VIDRRVVVSAVVAVLAALPATAQYSRVLRSDAELELAAAREAAIEVVSADPMGADAVAAARWWADRLMDLQLPDEILDVAAGQRDPELGFLLARIGSVLSGRPPAGSLATVEIAGPFGVFSDLDLERNVVPPDGELPPLGTPWRGRGSTYRLRMQTATGGAAPPEAMRDDGVYLAAWTLDLDDSFAGWMAVEATGGINLDVDGSDIAGCRDCGVFDPGVSWFRVRFDPGRHRIRVEMGSASGPTVRISLFDDDGRPYAVRLEASDQGPWSAASVEPALPPAAAALEKAIGEGAADVDRLLLAAALAADRRDPRGEQRWLENARDSVPEDPRPRLQLARFFVDGSTGSALESDMKRARAELRHCVDIPYARLIERAVALREQRPEDSERMLGELVESHRDDPRVLRLWVEQAMRQGWAREVEDGIADLAAELPESPAVARLRIDALEALDRFDERRALLRSLLRREILDPGLVEDLATGCQLDDAVTALERLDERIDDPNLEIGLVRLHLSRGDTPQAREVLNRARARWGDLPAFDQLQLAVSAGDDEALDRSLGEVFRRDPGNLRWRAMSWQRGTPSFFDRFRVDVEDVVQNEREPGSDIDVVLLLDQAAERIFLDGSSLYYYHGVSRAITPVGARQASRLQPLPDTLWLRVRIHKPDGRVVVPADLSFRDGSVELDDVKPGDLVEEEYVAPVPATAAVRRGHLSPYIYRFADPERAFGLSEYVLLVPPSVELDIEGNFSGLERKEWDEDGLRAIRWRSEDLPPIPPEPLAPPTQELLPWVSYGFGVEWSDVGDIIRDRALPVIRPTPEIERWSAPLLAASDPPQAAESLMASLCNEVDAGRSSFSLSESAGESFSRRQGNRLAILAAALAANGWEVDLVLARPRPFAGTHLGVPTLDAFTEPLLVARRDGGELWLDVEEQRRGVGHIRAIFQGGDGLVLPLDRPNEPVRLLETLPSFPNPDLEQRTTVKARIDGVGNAEIHFEMPVRGRDAEGLRARVEGVSEESARLAFERIAGSLFPGASDVEGRLSSTEDGVELQLDLGVRSACERRDDEMECRSLVLARPLVPVLASLPERTFPLILQIPLLRRIELELDPPDGWTIDRAPRRLQAGWGTVEERLEAGDGRFLSVLEIEMPAQTVSPEDYPAFARFCHAVDELVSRPPTLTRQPR